MIFWKTCATLFFIGKVPFFPGTWGSLFTLFLWLLVPLKVAIQLPLIILLIILGLYSSNIIAIALNKKDPSEIVIDEAIGMSIALFMIPHDFILYTLAFILFRYFDIMKPSFIYHIQRFEGGWGIVLDDIIAGLLTLSIVMTISIIF